MPEQAQEQEPIETTEPVQLPSDHPLVKALAAQKEHIKELKVKTSRLDEIEESQKTELQKALDRAEQAEAVVAKRDQAEAARALAAEVATAKGVSASVLRGSTREELEQHADEIRALLPDKPKAASPASGGDRGDDIDEEPKPVTPNELLRAAFQK